MDGWRGRERPLNKIKCSGPESCVLSSCSPQESKNRYTLTATFFGGDGVGETKTKLGRETREQRTPMKLILGLNDWSSVLTQSLGIFRCWPLNIFGLLRTRFAHDTFHASHEWIEFITRWTMDGYKKWIHDVMAHVHGWMDGWTSRRVDRRELGEEMGRRDGWLETMDGDGWTRDSMGGWIKWRLIEWINGLSQWPPAWIRRWMMMTNGPVNGWMDGWMNRPTEADGWKHGVNRWMLTKR